MADVAAVVLAAGRATRFGLGAHDSKVFALLDGLPLLVHVVAAAVASRAAPVVVVTGHAAGKADATLAGFTEITTVYNPAYASGVASSLGAGLAALPDGIGGTFVLLADMPFVRSGTLDLMIDEFARTQPDAVVPVHGVRSGNPVLIGRSLFPRVMTVVGDTGARAILAEPGTHVVRCAVEDPGIFADVDTPDMLAALTDPIRT